MKQLIKDNYKSIVDRGLITCKTTHGEFYLKMLEEVHEVSEQFVTENSEEMFNEVIDVVLTCLNWLEHYDLDIEKELQKKIDKNFQRAEN